ncbi:NAD(P)-dependent dehydrogenase (short-subunit alcohol dehydrogenase family) [Tepidamorphus gemmatus]|jgi:NAD(P)-dependent dehydrogenase (short-subunit alcohol dehydrogenase family)|uniref:NAD(P)-dependent dehydrogenase (Short-subunit alcohol dehydrogenase family) n=1 Tax=Tepidamorphus gemmatus TaxID=747076 RepID=A0A4R3MCR7_9HYPH|nr:SDR family NAD(P)-dependent oxidoreductase [Tepidamorphus gemmatus]TCT09817.1 NAD(P)-dependent dehydrogenase (short-subunit alcohol dehydrogenase family) [Tepidamorphus gemmatus]
MAGERGAAGRKRPAAIVTGGASGIGLGVTRRLLSDGWDVAVWDAAQTALDQASAELGERSERVRFYRVDVTDEAAVAAATDAAAEAFGRLDGLVNSAGIGLDAPFDETTAEQFRRILDVNVVGSFLASRAVARHLGRGGAIVNIGSVSGLRGNVGRVAYGASKGAVVTMTQVLAVELAPRGIRVNTVAPGPVETPLTAALHSDAIRAGWHAAVPMARYGTVEEIAAVTAFLLSDEAAYVTGQTLAVDGGFCAGGLKRG